MTYDEPKTPIEQLINFVESAQISFKEIDRLTDENIKLKSENEALKNLLIAQGMMNGNKNNFNNKNR